MSKIFKNMLPYWKGLIIVVALLVVQAWCDLSLPAYTSDIIDVGIQNKGVEHVLPEAVTEDEFTLAQLFMTDEEKKSWENSYEKDGDVYRLTVTDKKQLDELDDTLLLPLLMNYQMSSVDEQTFKESVAKQTGMDQAMLDNMSIEQIGESMGVPLTSFEKEVEDDDGNTVVTNCVDMRTIFAAMEASGAMTEEQILSMRDTVSDTIDTMGSSLVKSMGIAYAVSCDTAAGVDIDKVQTSYLWSAGGRMVAMKKCEPKYEPRCRIFFAEGQKFRTNLLVLFFDLSLKRETATKTALLAEVLRQGENPTGAARQAELLFGAHWDISVVKKGGRQLLLFSLETLKNVETEEMLAFLRERLFAPLQNGFTEKTVERQKKILRQKLENQRDDKKAFARRRAMEETAKGTALAISGDGYAEDLEEISAEGLLAFYRELLETAKVKVFFCGEKDEALLSLRQNFKGKAAAEEEAAPILKEKPHFLREETDAAQARLLLGFLGDVENSTRETALLLLNQLLGGDPDSFLFRKLREEEGLCYEIKSYRYPLSPYFFVQAGIRAEDAKRVCAELLSCLEEWKKNGISEERLDHAKESLIREYTALADSPWGMVDFLTEQALQGKELTTERLLRQIERTEAADVVRAAKHFRLQTVYLLQGKERTQDAD